MFIYQQKKSELTPHLLFVTSESNSDDYDNGWQLSAPNILLFSHHNLHSLSKSNKKS